MSHEVRDRSRHSAPAAPDPERVARVHRAGPNIDLHLDSLLWHRLFGYDLRRRHRNRLPRSPYGFHSDLPRMLEGGMSGAYFGLHAWPFSGERAWREVVRQIEVFHDYCASDARLRHGTTAEDFERGHADGLVVGCLGVEGAHCINGRLERVEQLYEAGVRYLTLAHFNRNRAATPAMGWGKNEHEGLSGFGRELVAELDRVGIIVDCAHLNEPCRLEAARLSRRPVWVTHSGVKGVLDHARNVSDASIDAIAATGGLIGIIFAPIFISGRLFGGVDDIIRHIRYVGERVGLEHVAVGTDFDGFIPSLPAGIADMSQLPVFTAALLGAGFSDDETRAILGGNVLRFLRRYQASGERREEDRRAASPVVTASAAAERAGNTAAVEIDS